MKRVSIFVAALALAAACEPTSRTAVVDGEHVIVKGHKITLHQLDAPDSKNSKCDAEKAVADLAEERLAGLLLAAKEVEFRKTGMACLQFMDCDGFVKADGIDVGETLIGEGLAAKKSADGSGDPPHDWCVERMPETDPAPAPPEQSVAPAAPQPN
jgi:endonuclease YncB( thermonuclease family)